MAASMIGSKVERKEGKKFLTGKGRYTADITLANQTFDILLDAITPKKQKIKKVDISKGKKANCN